LKYIIYKTTNLINNKFYIGKHKTNDINDDYMGSGTVLKKAFKKYGIDNFKREVLFILDTRVEANLKEKELVNEAFVERKDTYNIKEGGHGGWDHVNKILTHEQRQKTGLRGYNSLKKQKGKEGIKIFHKKLGRLGGIIASITKKGIHDPNFLKQGSPFKGREHTDQTKRKIAVAISKSQSGKQNSQYGTCWIYNLILKASIKINKEDLTSWIDKGWIKGRKMRW